MQAIVFIMIIYMRLFRGALGTSRVSWSTLGRASRAMLVIVSRLRYDDAGSDLEGNLGTQTQASK